MTMIQTKVSLSNFQPKRNLADLPTLHEVRLGSIIGVANGIKKSFLQDGITPAQGLTGNFEVQYDAQKDKDGKTPEAIQSGVAYLPDSFMLPIISMLAGEMNAEKEWVKEPVTSVGFAYDVFIVDANNPAKYTWQLRSKLAPSKNDPLEAMRALLADGEDHDDNGDGTKELEAPKVQAPAGKSKK